MKRQFQAFILLFIYIQIINAQITTTSNSFDDSTVYTDTILYTELTHPTIPKGICTNGCALGIVFPSWANSAGYSPFIGVDSSTTTYPCNVESESGTLFVDPTSGVCQMIVQTSGSTSYYIFKEISVPNNLSSQWFKINIPSILTNSHINESTDTATTSLFQKQTSGQYTTFAGIQGSINLPVDNEQVIPSSNCTFVMQDSGVNAKVQENVEAYFTFTTGIPATFTNELILQIPPEFGIDTSTDYNDYELTGDCYYDASSTSVESSGYKIIIGDYTMYTFLSGDITCTLKITNLIAPLYVSTTSSFEFYINMLQTNNVNNQFESSYINSGITFTPTSGEIQGVTLSVGDTTANQSTTYTFTLDLKRVLSQTATIDIIFPSEITLPGTGTCGGSGNSNINSVVSCSISGQTVTFSNIFISDYDATYDVILSIDSVTNPISTKPSSIFQFITYYDGTHVVDDSTTLTFTATGGSLTNPSVTPASTTVGDSNVSYSISFDSGSGLVAGGQIEIEFPSTIISSNTGSDSCSIVIGATASQAVTCTVQDSVTPNVVTLTSVPAIAKDDTVVVTINNEFQNPYMVSSTYGTYKIYTLTSAGYAVDSVTSGIFSIIDTPIAFNSNSLAYSDETNANTSTFTFTFEISVPHTDGDFIVITFPQLADGTYSFGSSTTCAATAVSSNLSGTQTCSLSGNQMTVKLKFASAGSTLSIGSTISFSISNMQNYKSFAPSTNPFAFSSYSSSGSTYLRQQETSSIYIVTSQVASISSVSVSSDIDYLEEEAVYTFSFNVKSYIPSGGTVQITFPNIFTFNSPALNSCTYTCSALNQISTYEYSFTATNFPTSSSVITFSISGVINPTYAVYSGLTGTEQFQFKTFDDSNFDMDYVQDGIFSLDCNLPCRSCSGSDPDSCLTCYTSVTGISETLFVVSANECVSACPSGTVDNLMNQCVTCTDPCATCGNNDPTHCLTCDNTYYLNASNQCVQECGDGFFEDDSLTPPYCTPCDGTTNFCQTCESLTECTSCVAPRLYYSPNNVCISDCETYTGNAMVNDPTNTNCVSCVSPCATCTGDVNTCLSCVTGYYYLSADQACYNPCPDGYGISGSDCLVCDPSYNCATCPNDITTCTSCPTGFYYKSDTNECLAACPAGYYVNGDNCTKCNKACATCTASKVCQTCNTGYDILFSDFCYTVCPSDYPHYIGGTCLSNDDACGENCAKCYTNDDLTCYECDSPFLLYGDGECVASCPDGYEPNSEETQCVEESAYTENFESYRHIPIPITLLSIPFAFSVYISKKQYPITYLAGSLVSIICVFEYAAYMVLAFFYWQRINDEVSDGEIDSVSSSKTVLLLLISVISLYLWNLMAAINFCFFFSADKKFRQWKAQSYGHEISDNILRFLGFFLTFRLMRFYYSRYFDYTYFKMKLESVNKLLCLNFITVCSVLAVNIPMIFGAGSVIYFTDKVDQIFWQALDVLILSLLMIVLLIYENKKEKNFFEDKDEGLNQTLMGLNSKGFNDNNISQAYSQYPYGKNMHYLDVKDQDEDNEEFKEDKKNTEENNAIQNPLSEHDIPGQGESVNQAQLAPHMQYQQQEETVVPGKPRQFSSNRLNPYKKYQVLNPIVEEEEYEDPKENKTKIFMDDNDNINEIKKEKKLNFSYSEESFYIGPNENEISFYDDNFEPDTPLRQNKIDHLTCIRPGYFEMSRGLGINNDNRGINNDDEDILELSNMSDMSDFDIQKPVKFNQVNGNNIQQSRKNLLNTMITDNDNDFDENYTISEFKPGQKNMRKYKKQNEDKQINFDQKSQGSIGKKSNQDINQNKDKNQKNDQNDDLIYIDIEQQYRIASNEQQKRNSSTSDFNQNNISLQELDSNTKLKSQNPILEENKNNKKASFIIDKDKINNDQIIKESSQENSLFEDKKKQSRKSKNFGKKSKNFDLGTSSLNKENSSQVKNQEGQDKNQENSEMQINQQMKENQNKEKPENNQEKSVQSQKQINNDNENVHDISASKNELEMGKKKSLNEQKQEKLNDQKNLDNFQNKSESKKDEEKNKEQDFNDLDQQKQQEEQKQSQKLNKNENQSNKNVRIDNGNKNKQHEKQSEDNKLINASNNLIGINNISHISEIPMSNENRLKENLKNKLKNKGEEELESLGDSQVLQNQISPSDFNYLNMRFDDNFLENDFIKVDQNNSNQKDENNQNYDNKSQNHRTQIQPSSLKFQSGLINKQKSVESQNLQDMIDFSDYDEYQNRKKDQNPQENLPNKQMLASQENNLINNQSQQSNFKKKKKAYKNNNKKGSGQFLNSQRSQRSVDKNKQNKDLIQSKYTDDQFKQLGIKEMASHLQQEQIKKGVTKKINLNEDKRLKELEKIYMRNNKNQYSARSQQKNKNDVDLDFLQESD